MAERVRLVPNPWDAACPSREVLAMVGDKWALLLMPKLADGPKRNGELIRALAGVSQKMLTQTLRDMERNGLVVRRDFQEVPPRVEYELTELGRSLGKVVAALDQWVVDNYYEVEKARGAFDRAA
ncbi:MAG: winged helix-turn-helix transcriptional regulator [Allosphingosinicella sp.]|uniref:winged helix-turn-helix transcriptional regulator n=1 Tax=Allosphingosinicella sp. TaxID=2823234 RepID=UPI00395643AD